jgi:hypothetical protein
MEPINTKVNPTVKTLADIKHNLYNLRAALKAGQVQDVIDSLNYEEGRIDTLINFNNQP